MTDTEQAMEHANKVLTMSVEELRAEKAWQGGAGLREIIDNIIRYLTKGGKLVLIAKLQGIRKEVAEPEQPDAGATPQPQLFGYE